MTEIKLPKYRVVSAQTESTFEGKINALAEKGYTFKAFMESEDMHMLVAVMSIAENDYSNVIAIKDVSPELANDALSAGWEPVSMSLSTKFIRMVRRKKT